MNTTTLLDGTTNEGIRIAHTVVAEACQSHTDLRSTMLIQRGADYRCKIGDRTEVVIRFDTVGTATRIVVDVVEERLTGFARVRRRRTPALAVAFADAVEHAIVALDGATRRVAVNLAS